MITALDDSVQAMALAYLTGDYIMKAIADHFGIHNTTMSTYRAGL